MLFRVVGTICATIPLAVANLALRRSSQVSLILLGDFIKPFKRHSTRLVLPVFNVYLVRKWTAQLPLPPRSAERGASIQT